MRTDGVRTMTATDTGIATGAAGAEAAPLEVAAVVVAAAVRMGRVARGVMWIGIAVVVGVAAGVTVDTRAVKMTGAGDVRDPGNDQSAIGSRDGIDHLRPSPADPALLIGGVATDVRSRPVTRVAGAKFMGTIAVALRQRSTVCEGWAHARH